MLPAQVKGVTISLSGALGDWPFPGAFAGVYFHRRRNTSLLSESADWMNRNMLRRIELAWPVNDGGRQRA
jgi:polyphosphate kinase